VCACAGGRDLQRPSLLGDSTLFNIFTSVPDPKHFWNESGSLVRYQDLVNPGPDPVPDPSLFKHVWRAIVLTILMLTQHTWCWYCLWNKVTKYREKKTFYYSKPGGQRQQWKLNISLLTNLKCKMILDLIVVLKKGEDPEPEEIILVPDPRWPKCYGSFGSGTLNFTHINSQPTYEIKGQYIFQRSVRDFLRGPELPYCIELRPGWTFFGSKESRLAHARYYRHQEQPSCTVIKTMHSH
jgi:hypothetical protein